MNTSTNRPDQQDAVLLVMRGAANRKHVAAFLARAHLQCLWTDEPDTLAQLLGRCSTIRLAIVDVSGLGAEIQTICRALCEGGVPFVLLTPPSSLTASGLALRYGAQTVLPKPIAKRALWQLVERLREGQPTASQRL